MLDTKHYSPSYYLFKQKVTLFIALKKKLNNCSKPPNSHLYLWAQGKRLHSTQLVNSPKNLKTQQPQRGVVAGTLSKTCRFMRLPHEPTIKNHYCMMVWCNKRHFDLCSPRLNSLQSPQTLSKEHLTYFFWTSISCSFAKDFWPVIETTFRPVPSV